MEEVNDMHRLPPKLLIISQNGENKKQYLYSLSENISEKRVIHELGHKHILHSTHDGWFVLVDYNNNDSCLWNPSTRETIHLPKLQDLRTYDQCVLSKSPTDPNCYILFISYNFISFCLVGSEDDEFNKQSFEEGMILNTLTAVSFQGKIYCRTRHGPGPGHQFLIVHIIGKTLELRPILPWNVLTRDLPPTWTRVWRTYLLESIHGELLLVDGMMACPWLYDAGMLFRVYRVDFNRKECVQLYDIGNQAIFLSHGKNNRNWGGFCCSSSQGVKPNSIYCVAPDDRNLYIYDLDDMSLNVVLLPCGPLNSSQLRSYWVGSQVFHD